MQRRQSRPRRWLMLVLLSFAVILLTSPYEPSKQRSFRWAAEPIQTRKITDRVALSPPAGYSFTPSDPPETAWVENWTVLPLNKQQPGSLSITAQEEKLWTFMETFEDHCIEWHIDRLRDRYPAISTVQFIDGQRACSTTTGRAKKEDSPSHIRTLCRNDGCWSFRIYGIHLADHISGELLEIFDTIRFVPVPDPEPDFRLGE